MSSDIKTVVFGLVETAVLKALQGKLSTLDTSDRNTKLLEAILTKLDPTNPLLGEPLRPQRP